jgi:hypothetical protein
MHKISYSNMHKEKGTWFLAQCPIVDVSTNDPMLAAKVSWTQSFALVSAIGIGALYHPVQQNINKINEVERQQHI